MHQFDTRYFNAERTSWLWLVLFFALSLPIGVSAIELDRSVVSSLKAHDLRLWLQEDYASPSLDLFGYGQKTTGSSSLDLYANTTLGFRYGLTDRLNIRYAFSYMRQQVSRATAPRQLNTNSYAHDVRLQGIFYQTKALNLALELGFRSHKADTLNIYDYQFGSAYVSWGGRPLVTVDAKDQAWIAALRGSWDIAEHWRLHIGAEARKLRVSSLMRSDHPAIDALLAPTAPQRTPWNERHLLFQAALDWQVVQAMALSLDYTHYQISRSGYIPNPNKLDYSTQDQLDGFLTWQMSKQWAVYGHARVNRRFLLGDLPLSYNRRVNHRFKDMFGFVSMGIDFAY